MSRALGENQRDLLKTTRQMGPYPGGGWTWGNYSQTMKIIRPLIKRGYIVEKECKSIYAGCSNYKSYELTEEGRLTADDIIEEGEREKARRRAERAASA